MLLAPPPPPCRANALQYTVSAQGATQGLMISVAVSTRRACLLPARPEVQVRVNGHLARTAKRRFPLGSEYRPRRLITARSGAIAILRWENYCGSSGIVQLQLTIGGERAIQLVGPAAAPPVCVVRGRASTLGVSLFVAR